MCGSAIAPTVALGGRVALALVNSFSITNVGKNPDQAWLLCKHLLSAETQKASVPRRGDRFPAFKNVALQTAYPWEDAAVYRTTAAIMRRPWSSCSFSPNASSCAASP
jgi:ABC-type glycerol-3-phosphate transport system substrate-binding protein